MGTVRGTPEMTTSSLSKPGGTGFFKEFIMGKYLIGWLLGVPVVVLVILYFFFH